MVVDCTFFIPCGEPSVLLEAINHPLDPFAGPVDGPGKGAGPALVPAPGNGDPDAVLAAVLPNSPTAIALVAHHPPWPQLGPASPGPLHGSLGHQVRKHRGLMPVAGGEDEGHELPLTFGPDVDFGTEAALTPPERFSVRVSAGGACCMLVRADDGAVDIVHLPVEVARTVSVLLEGGQEACPEARFAPAIKTARDRAPGAIPLGEVTPGGACTENP